MKLYILFLCVSCSGAAFAKSSVGSFSKDLGIGHAYFLKAETAVTEKLDLESSAGYSSFPGLKTFLASDLGNVREACTRLHPQFMESGREMLQTGTGGGRIDLLFIDSVQCSWNVVKSKVYLVNVSFAGESSSAKVYKITPIAP